MKLITILCLSLLVSFSVLAQNTKYYIIPKKDANMYEKADLRSRVARIAKKGKNIDIKDAVGNFVQTTDNLYIHGSQVNAYVNKVVRSDINIENSGNSYKKQVQNASKQGLNLNNNTRDFRELPDRDTVKIFKFHNE